MPQPPTARDALDRLGLESICDRIREGQSVNEICRSIEISASAFWRWIEADAERSARVRVSRTASAAAMEEKAETVLLDKQMEIQRARELASHYRWAAKVRNPREYGEKLELTGEMTIQNLTSEEVEARASALLIEIAEAERRIQQAAAIGLDNNPVKWECGACGKRFDAAADWREHGLRAHDQEF
jgi:hypothetical protein